MRFVPGCVLWVISDSGIWPYAGPGGVCAFCLGVQGFPLARCSSEHVYAPRCLAPRWGCWGCEHYTSWKAHGNVSGESKRSGAQKGGGWRKAGGNSKAVAVPLRFASRPEEGGRHFIEQGTRGAIKGKKAERQKGKRQGACAGRVGLCL